MAENGSRKKRREGGREDLRQRRAERRERTRTAGGGAESEARITLLQRIGLRLRELGWALQENLLWPLSDWGLVAIDAARWPFERAAWAIRENLLWPAQDRIAGSSQGGFALPRKATLGLLGALAVGALATGTVVAAGGGDGDGPSAETRPVVAAVEEPAEQTQEPDSTVADPEPPAARLKGVSPKFGAKSAKERREARQALRKLRAQEEQRNAAAQSDPDIADDGEGRDGVAGAPESAGQVDPEPPEAEEDLIAGTGNEANTGATSSNAAQKKARRKESPLSVAERFAMAFVSYEVGAAGKPTERVFKDTTDRDLFKSLTERPPRQPDGNKVPKARVVNVVGGPRKDKSMEISVGLLRVDGLSELRLDLKRSGRGWVVRTVRG